MMSSGPSSLRAMLDREAIRECLYAYCRGMDRCDRDLCRSVYWPEAIDHHNVGFKGSAFDFIDVCMTALATIETTIHSLTNVMIRLESTLAYSESQFQAYHRLRNGDGIFIDVVILGRFLDKFEKRGEEWRILYRSVAFDWFREYPDSANWDRGVLGMGPMPHSARKPDDLLYVVYGGALAKV